MNLMVNARDAMPAGGSLTIVTANADVARNSSDAIEPGRYVTLTVRDTARESTRRRCRQIFEPFFTTKDSDKGTGLGLSTVYGIVKQSGGYIVVESEVGVGSEFTIYMRRADDVVSNLRPTAPCAVAPSASPRVDRVLVVEDEEVIRGLVDQVLRVRATTCCWRRTATRRSSWPKQPRRRAADRPDDAGHRRPRARRPAPCGCAGAEGDVHVRLRRGRDFSATALPPATAFLEKPFTFTMLSERIRELIAAPIDESLL